MLCLSCPFVGGGEACTVLGCDRRGPVRVRGLANRSSARKGSHGRARPTVPGGLADGRDDLREARVHLRGCGVRGDTVSQGRGRQ